MRNFLNLQLNIDLKFLSYILKIRNLRLTFMNIQKNWKNHFEIFGSIFMFKKKALNKVQEGSF